MLHYGICTEESKVCCKVNHLEVMTGSKIIIICIRKAEPAPKKHKPLADSKYVGQNECNDVCI